MSMWTKWAPPFEKSKLNSMSLAGSVFGGIVVLPIAGAIISYLTWEAVFYVAGVSKNSKNRKQIFFVDFKAFLNAFTISNLVFLYCRQNFEIIFLLMKAKSIFLAFNKNFC